MIKSALPVQQTHSTKLQPLKIIINFLTIYIEHLLKLFGLKSFFLLFLFFFYLSLLK